MPTPLRILITAVRTAQAELATYVEPGERDPEQTISELSGILDHEDVLEALRVLEGNPAD